jgi:hypothetical protein
MSSVSEGQCVLVQRSTHCPCMLALQVALTLIVLLVAYVLQQRFTPFVLVPEAQDGAATRQVRRRGVVSASGGRDGGDAVVVDSTSGRTADALQPSAGIQRRVSRMVGSVAGLSTVMAANRHIRTLASRAARLLRQALCDYNNLESTFLISAELILLSGMVFYSRGFPKGSVGYVLLTVVVAVLIVSCSVTFAALVVAEVYRSFRDAAQHDALRQLEVERNEHAMLKKQGTVQQRGGGGGRGHSDSWLATPASVTGDGPGAQPVDAVISFNPMNDMGPQPRPDRGVRAARAAAASWHRASVAAGKTQARRSVHDGGSDAGVADPRRTSRAAAFAIAAIQAKRHADPSSREWVKSLQVAPYSASASASAPTTVRSGRHGDHGDD